MEPEQPAQIKTQLIDQINSNFPEEKKNDALSQVEEMNDEQLIEFVKQNNLVKGSEGGESSIFRAIVSGDVPSHKIEENNEAIAVLEINPASKGHVIILPRSPASSKKEIPKTAFELAEKISKKLKSKLKAKDVKISSQNTFREEIINIIPVYEDTPENPQRYKAEDSELNFVKEELKEKPKKEVIEESKVEFLKDIKLPKRIP